MGSQSAPLAVKALKSDRVRWMLGVKSCIIQRCIDSESNHVNANKRMIIFQVVDSQNSRSILIIPEKFFSSRIVFKSKTS